MPSIREFWWYRGIITFVQLWMKVFLIFLDVYKNNKAIIYVKIIGATVLLPGFILIIIEFRIK